MANVSKDYGVGDTVYVHYIGKSNQFIPVQRVVSRVNVKTLSNEATVEFESGDSVVDGAVVTVYTTQALAANGIITWMIAQSVAVATLSSTLSEASTASQASTTLGLIG